MATKLMRIIPKEKAGIPFKIKSESTENVVDSFFKILNDKYVGMHVRSFLPGEYCKQVEKRFHESPLKKPREDGVPGYEAGVTQYKKEPLNLSCLSYNQHGLIRSLIGDAHNPIMDFYRKIGLMGAKLGYTVRPATYGAESITIIRAIQWAKNNKNDKMLLELHDDLGQIKAKINSGFEIQQAQKLIAINFYPRAEENSGQLKVVNWSPTDEEREKLGVSETGYPYFQENLPLNVESKVISPQTGDLIVMDGSYVHGVMVGQDKCPERLIINGFAALLKNNHIVLFA